MVRCDASATSGPVQLWQPCSFASRVFISENNARQAPRSTFHNDGKIRPICDHRQRICGARRNLIFEKFSGYIAGDLQRFGYGSSLSDETLDIICCCKINTLRQPFYADFDDVFHMLQFIAIVKKRH
jgi:hypothetical protein